ncbi:MAG: hypothetical protein ABEN55_23715 [Bradymonadaceae bacterium]
MTRSVRLPVVALLAIVPLLAMCTTVEQGKITDGKVLQKSSMVDLKKRAGFDLDCERSQIDLTALTQFELAPSGGPSSDEVQVGAEGCGKRGVYVWSDDKGWVLNSANGQVPSGNEKSQQ